MPHLSLIERIRIIKIFNEYDSRTKPSYMNISRKTKEIYNIKISDEAVKYIILKWLSNKSLADRPRNNKSKCLISRDGVLANNKALLNNPFLATKKIRMQLVLG